jgi:hypothetical protein
LVCLNPWVPAGENAQDITVEPTQNTIEEPAPSPSARRLFEHALAGMNRREKTTWIVAVLAFLLLVSLTIHARRIQAGTNRSGGVGAITMGRLGEQEGLQPQALADSNPNVDIALSAIARDVAEARHRRKIRHSTTAPTTQESLAMDDALPPDLQIGGFNLRFDPDNRTVMQFEQQSEERVGAVLASPSDSVPQTGTRFVGAARASVGQSDWAMLQISKFLVGSDPNGWSVVLFDPNTIAAPGSQSPSFIPFAFVGGASSSAVATGFHLSSGVPPDSPSLGAGNPETTGGVGVEPPQLGGGLSPTPEPGGLVLFGLAAGPILLKRRRGVPVMQS